MNFAKINTFLLIAVILILAAIFYFVFINKKDMNALWEMLTPVKKGKGIKQDTEEHEGSQLETSQPETADDGPVEPTEEDWKYIYAISEKLYFKKPLTIYEKRIQHKFEVQVQNDLDFCQVFYPVVEAIVAGTQLTEDQEIFYAANKELVDKQVEHRKEVGTSAGLSAGNEQSADKKPETTHDLTKSSPPLSTDKRNETILSFFEDGIPKTVKKLTQLYFEATGQDYGKNAYRVFGSLEGKYLTPFKKGKITYYCLPEWFEGRKLKEQFKVQIA